MYNGIRPETDPEDREKLQHALEILRRGSGVAKEAAAQTLDKVKHAMQIDYFA